jgi:hypothetical protein
MVCLLVVLRFLFSSTLCTVGYLTVGVVNGGSFPVCWLVVCRRQSCVGVSRRKCYMIVWGVLERGDFAAGVGCLFVVFGLVGHC